MRYFKNTSRRDEQRVKPKNTVGSALREGPGHVFSDKERRLRQIEASVKMNKNKLGRLFAHFTQEQLKSPEVLKPKTDDERTN